MEILLSDECEPLLRFLRDAHYTEGNSGSFQPPEGDATACRMFQIGRKLLLLEESGPGRCRLTPLGYELGNVGKEYCNWIDAGRRLPDGVTREMLAGRRLLDVGCSFGRFLASFSGCGAAVCGIDFQENYLRLSRVIAVREGVRPPVVARARAEQLPFPDASFDIVFCRLVLNYVHDVAGTMREFARVLVPGGRLVLIVSTFGDGLKSLFRMRWIGNGRSTAWLVFALLNTMLLQITGRQCRMRVGGRIHQVHSPTYPTVGWVRRTLSRLGSSLADAGEAARSRELFIAVRAARKGNTRFRYEEQDGSRKSSA